MKIYLSKQTTQAMTRTDVLVIVLIFVFIIFFVLGLFMKKGPARHRRPSFNSYISCINNLKQTALAARIWQGDNNNLFPMQVSVTNGGAMESVSAGNAAAFFQVMSNELSTTKILVCPADTDHTVAKNFGTGFGNSHISYFAGLNADASHPDELLSGDDNFAVGGSLVKSGLLDISTTAPVSWTEARHRFRGNIAMADGSVFMYTNAATTQGDFQMRRVGEPNYSAASSDRLAIP